MVEAGCGNYSPLSPVLHVVVVGFHHKKGCQVEYAHPPLIPGGESTSSELPSQWRNLPSLALPDGSHNWDSDTVYFHLPALHNPRKTVFGISCYRQIDAEKIKNKTSDITRGTVQKSVCVLSRLPLYGQIQVKMSLITQAYFEEGDFSNVDLIKETYSNLNSCLSDDMLHTQQLYVGLSARDFILHFKQRALVLFKLVLLERKVLFFKSPVRELSGHILTLLSLFPGLLEAGLDEAACIVPVDTPTSSPLHSLVVENAEEVDSSSVRSVSPTSSVHSYIPTSDSISNLSSKVKDRLSGAIGYIAGTKPGPSQSPSTTDLSQVAETAEEVTVPEEPELPSFSKVSNLTLSELGLPLRVYTAGNLCHPYLSLPYLDILTQPSIHGYVIGATNALFKAKKDLSDAVVDIDEETLVFKDPELRRALALTTEDLRFIDNVIRVVGSDDQRGEFMEGVGWEGGDEWVRAQFRFYLVCLLRTSLLPQDTNEMHLYNSHYTTQLRETKFHTAWKSDPPIGLVGLVPGHPCSGAVGVSDVKLRLSHTMTNTDGGKKVTAAMASTGRVVSGGIGAAKGAFSSWFGGLRGVERGSKESSPVDDIPADLAEAAEVEGDVIDSLDKKEQQ